MKISLTILLLVLFSVYVQAEDSQEETVEKIEEKKEPFTIPFTDYPLILMDTTQESVESSVTMVSNRLDSFFGTQRADDELSRSQLRLQYSYFMSELTGKDDYAIRANLRLNNLENWFRRKYNSFMGKKTPKKGEKTSEELNEERRRTHPHDWLVRTDVGLNVSIPPRTFIRSRARKSFETGKWIHRFVEEIGWYSEESWINTTTFDSDYALKENKLLRFTHLANFLITDQEFTTSHGPSIYHTTSDSDALAYNMRLNTREKYDAYYFDGYSLSIAYRRRLRGTWLYGEVTPALDFPKIVSYRRAPSLFMRVEILFGGIRDDVSLNTTSRSTP